jgi:epsilon-lactone hydrolase
MSAPREGLAESHAVTTEEGNRSGQAGISVPAKFIPVPTSVSEAAQRFMAMVPPLNSPSVPSSRDDASAWADYVDAGNRGIMAVTQHFADTYPGDVVTHQLPNCALYQIDPLNLAPENADKAILYVHGGGFAVGGGQAAIYPGLQIASLSRTRTYSVDYRMLPRFAFPAPLDDTLEAYRFVINEVASQRIGLFGASAGANLAATCVLKARALGIELPAACALHSPAADMTNSGDSLYTNESIDMVLTHVPEGISDFYAGGHDPRDPLLSPIFADFKSGFPPTILSTGTRDLLLSSTVMLHRAMRRGGIEADLHVFEAMSHVPFLGAPEEAELYGEHIAFLLDHMLHS